MKQGRRFGLSVEQKLDVWRRWKAGQTLHQIGRAFGKEHSSIRCLMARHGGIAPAVRRRALLALTLREREEISRGLASGSSIRDIAKCLERAVSTVSREIARHGGRPAYRASQMCIPSFQESGISSQQTSKRAEIRTIVAWISCIGRAWTIAVLSNSW